MLQGKRDVETVLTMGIMEDVNIIPQPAGDKMMPTSLNDLVLICIHFAINPELCSAYFQTVLEYMFMFPS